VGEIERKYSGVSLSSHAPASYTLTMRLFLALLLFLNLLPILPARQFHRPSPDAKAKAQAEEPTPVDVAPEPTDPAERALRAIRNRLQNSHNLPPIAAQGQNRDPASAKRSRFDTRPSGPASGIFVDRAPFPPNTRPEDFQFPVAGSDAIFLGSVTRVQPYLSEDGTNLYTEFTISVEEPFKDSAGLSLKRNSVVTLFRIGGSIRLPSGKVVRTEVHGLGDPPAAGHRYVCFLNYDARGYWFRIDKLWELRNGVAAPLDPIDEGLAQAGRSQFAGMSEADFLAAVRDAVGRAGVQR
jgi:hypothetical protein